MLIILGGDNVGSSDSGKRVILVVIIPPTVPLIITTSLFKFVVSISGVGGPDVELSPIRSNLFSSFGRKKREKIKIKLKKQILE